MSTQLAKQITTRMKAKNFSLAALEREAGLKNHSVRNILRGKSKKPSAEILQAVADVLGCTVKELLENRELFQENETTESEHEVLNHIYQNKKLLAEIVELTNRKILESGYSITVQQAFTCIEEIYVHCLQKNLEKVDEEFVNWFVELVGN